LPDFPWYKKPKWKNIPNDHKIYRMATELSNGRKIDQHKALQGPRIFTQIGILGFKVYHLATLLWGGKWKSFCKSLFFVV
jgi:hypothetical protein